MSFRLTALLVLLALISHGILASVAYSANRTWAGGAGEFGTAASWVGAVVPGAADSATFSSAGTFNVTFDNTPALPNPVQNLSLTITTGNPTFISTATDGVYTYHLTGAAGGDVAITGGNLTLGSGATPLNLTADDEILVRGGATFNVNVGSQVNTADLLLGTVQAGGNGTVTVNASTLNVTGDTTLGLFGNTATINFTNSAQGTLSTAGTVRVGVDTTGVGGTVATLSVASAADVLVGNVLVGTSATSARGTLQVNGLGSTVEHVGATSLTIGGPDTSGSESLLDLENLAIYRVGTGTTTVRGQGAIDINNSQFITQGDVNINTTADPAVTARIVLDNNGIFTQIGDADITVGAVSNVPPSLSTSTIRLMSTGATFTTGTGLLTINKTGVLQLDNGTFSANGDVLIDAGVLNRPSSAAFVVAPGKEMTIQNGGRAIFGGSYSASPNAAIQVAGSASRLEVTGGFTINTGAEVRLSSGAIFTSLGSNTTIGSAGVGTLEASGIGTTVTMGGGPNAWGSNGGIAVVSFSDGATADVNGTLNLAGTNIPGTTAIVDVESAARLTSGTMQLAASGGATTSATLNISGPGSSVILDNAATLTVGHTSSGTAVINVLDGGTLIVGTGGGVTQLFATGVINIDGGIVDLKNFTTTSGKVNFTSGALTFAGNVLTIGAGGFLGENLTLNANKSLTVAGAVNVDANSLLLLEDDAQLGTTTLNINGAVRGSGRITGSVANMASGEIRVGISDQLRLTGTLNNMGDVVAIGTAAAPAELKISGATTNAATGLIVGRDAILQFDGQLTNSGSLVLNLGTNDVFGVVTNTAGQIVVTGGASATFYDNVAQNGSLTVSKVGSTTSVAVFLGDVTGAGGSGGGDIFFHGAVQPGSSPAAVTYQNNVYFGDGTELEIEIGGQTPGTQHDKLIVDGTLNLDGVLNVSLLPGFTPANGNTFDILDWTTRIGTFDTLNLPSLGGGLSWNTSLLYSTGVLSIGTSVALAGDFNSDGAVNAADYVAWRKGVGVASTPANYNLWRTNYGRSGSGSSGEQAGVPEPAMFALALVGVFQLLMVSARDATLRR